MNIYDNSLEMSPYDELRDAQKDGIEQAIEAAEHDGFLVLEGACGTGKTLLSMLPFLSYVEDPSSKYERVVAITSVKQQMEIFEKEVENINEQRVEDGELPFSSITLSGKSDVCPYVKHNAIEGKSIQTTCESLREGTRKALEDAEDKEQGAELLADRSSEGEIRRFDSDGAFTYPYPVDNEPETSYCPFYAGYLAERYGAMEDGDYDPAEVVPQDLKTSGVISKTDVVRESGAAGMCPHSVMGDLLETTDVVIGNYQHLFDPKTRNFSDAAIDENTLLIVDEAHNIVPRVRDILSRKMTLTLFKDGVRELQEVDAVMNDKFGTEGHWDAKSKLSGESSIFKTVQGVEKGEEFFGLYRDKDISTFISSDIEDEFKDQFNTDNVTFGKVIDTYEEILSKLYTKIMEFLDGKVDTSISDDDEQVVALRDTDSLGQDNFTQYLTMSGNAELLSFIDKIGVVVTELLSEFHQEVYDQPINESQFQEISEFWSDWITLDHRRYFPAISVTDRNYLPNAKRISKEWQEEITTTLELKNCLPRNEIQEIVSEVGAGIFMSATLEPLDMYIEETGLSDFTERPILQQTYGLHYPKENRETFTVNTTPFTSSNRGRRFDYTGSYNQEGVRKEYMDTIVSTVKTTPGNVLVTMPSYSECEWAGEVVEDNTNVMKSDILVDSSSSLSSTTELKEEFFDGGKKVLITSAMGTLTEGVDYEKDKLLSVVVCGVPIVNTYTKFHKAVRTTYDEFFTDGYELAFTLPAVRKTRQAVGRVIRSSDERGIRILADKRYVQSIDNWDSVHKFFPEYVMEETVEETVSGLETACEEFWNN